MKRITVQQKRAVRCIENLHYLEHTSPAFSELKLLKITQLFEFKLLIRICNEIKLDESAFYRQYQPPNMYYTFRHELYKTPMIRTNYGTQTFGYLIPCFLNKHPNIPKMVHESYSIHAFKRDVKQYLLTRTME